MRTKKTEFLRALADWTINNSACIHTNTSNCFWIDYYSLCPCYAHNTAQKMKFSITDFFGECDIYCRNPKWKKYRQMCGGRFLVNLLEVLDSKRILRCRSLFKENINFWKEDLTSENQECLAVIDIFDIRTKKP